MPGGSGGGGGGGGGRSRRSRSSRPKLTPEQRGQQFMARSLAPLVAAAAMSAATSSSDGFDGDNNNHDNNDHNSGAAATPGMTSSARRRRRRRANGATSELQRAAVEAATCVYRGGAWEKQVEAAASALESSDICAGRVRAYGRGGARGHLQDWRARGLGVVAVLALVLVGLAAVFIPAGAPSTVVELDRGTAVFTAPPVLPRRATVHGVEVVPANDAYASWDGVKECTASSVFLACGDATETRHRRGAAQTAASYDAAPQDEAATLPPVVLHRKMNLPSGAYAAWYSPSEALPHGADQISAQLTVYTTGRGIRVGTCASPTCGSTVRRAMKKEAINRMPDLHDATLDDAARAAADRGEPINVTIDVSGRGQAGYFVFNSAWWAADVDLTWSVSAQMPYLPPNPATTTRVSALQDVASSAFPPTFECLDADGVSLAVDDEAPCDVATVRLLGEAPEYPLPLDAALNRLTSNVAEFAFLVCLPVGIALIAGVACMNEAWQSALLRAIVQDVEAHATDRLVTQHGGATTKKDQ